VSTTLRRRGLRVATRTAALACFAAGALAGLPPVAGSAAILATYSPSVSPTTAAAGSVTTYNAKIMNDNPLGSLDVINSATFTFPAGFAGLSTPSSVTDSAGGTWTVSRSGNTITLNGSMGPTVSVSVPVAATTPTAVGSYQLTTGAKGGINGLLGQSFDRTGNEPTVTVTPGAPAKVAFGQQPTTAKKGVAISPAVKAVIQDAYGNTVPTYSSPVTLGAAFNPNTGNATNPSGLPMSATPSNGVATFPNVAINDQGIGYKLSADSGSLTPSTSSSFDVEGYAAACPAAHSCDSGAIGNPADTTADVVDNTGVHNDFFTVTVGGQSAPPCSVVNAGYGQAATFDNQDTTRTMTVTLVVNDNVAPTEDQDGFKHWGVCFESTNPFTTSSGAGATPTGDGHYYGFLQTCTKAHNIAPCTVSIGENSDDDIVGVFKSTPGDPKGVFGLLG
jgi:hypothetical protein